MSKIVYRMTGAFGEGNESSNFFSHNRPALEIVENPDAVSVSPAPTPAEHGWYELTVSTLNESVAQQALAEINGVEPRQIKIVQLSL